MEEDLLSRANVVTDKRAAAMLANIKQRHILMLFAQGPASLTQGSARSGVELKQLHYHVNKLCSVGLLRVAAIVRRAGRPIKLYESISESFLIPDEVMPQPFMQTAAQELQQSLLQQGFRAGRATLFALRPDGTMLTKRVDGPGGTPPIMEVYLLIHIEPQELREFEAELRLLAQRFKRKPSRVTRRFIFHAAAAPRLSQI